MGVLKALPSQTLTFTEGGTVGTVVEGDYVKITGDMQVEKAGAAESAIGAVIMPADEFGYVTILINKPVLELSVDTAVTAGEDLQAGGAGAVSALDTGNKVGVALKAAESGKKTLVAFTA